MQEKCALIYKGVSAAMIPPGSVCSEEAPLVVPA